MNTSTSTRRMASLLSTLTASAALALGATGCAFTGSASLDTTDPYVEPAPIETTIAAVSIDPGATMAADPGYGVGVFAQYDQGGFWTVYTTCDTEISGTSCNFDILAYADARVQRIYGGTNEIMKEVITRAMGLGAK